MKWYLKVLKNYANYKGRAQRKEFWFFLLITYFVSVFLMLMEIGVSGGKTPYVSLIYFYATIVPFICVTIRRFHDTGKSGKWIFLMLIPFGALFCLCWLAKPSTRETNKYGPPPEGVAFDSENRNHGTAETWLPNMRSNSPGNYQSQYQSIRQPIQTNPYDLSTIEGLAVRELQLYGKIHAIKLVREKMGYSLYDAKVFVENLELVLSTYPQAPIQEDPQPYDVSSVDGMEGHAFEYYCAELLRKNKFVNVSVTPGSGDQGVDIIATKDGIKYAIQCKNYASALSNTPIQEVSAGKVFYNCHVGVVLTNSTFTHSAKELAKATGVLLWDRSKLQELMTASVPTSKMTTPEATTQTTPQSSKQVPVTQPTYVRESMVQTPVVVPVAAHTFDTAQPKVDSTSFSAVSFTSREASKIVAEIEGVQICVHNGSANAVNLVLTNFGLDKDDDAPDELTLLFDVEAKNARGIPEDITIVCNAFAGNIKLATEYEYLYKKDFYWKDSLEVYFDKRNLSNRTTRIEIFCKRG